MSETPTDASATHLDRPMTSLHGRDADIAQVVDAVTRGERLISFTGAAGFGKTRLALASARRLADERAWPGGVRLCRLREAKERDEILAVVAATLGLPSSAARGDEDNSAVLGRRLRESGPTLLVLDELERIVALVGPLVSRWLAAAPELVVLATTRERLGVAGERCHVVGPLSLPVAGADPGQAAAVALYVDRARVVYPALRTTDEALATIGALVARLDGNPLAIELAAARAALLSPAQLLARSHDRFELLRPSAAAAGTTRGLWDALWLSWETLSPSERRTLGHLAVFRGGATLDAVERVLRGEASSLEVIDDVQALVDKSLVVSASGDDGARRLTLYESVQAFVLGQLERRPEDAAAARARHRAWFVALAAELDVAVEGPDGVRAWRQLVAERDNGFAVVDQGAAPGAPAEVFEEAVRALIALRHLLESHGLLRRGRERFDALAPRAGLLPLALRARFHAERGAFHTRFGSADAARAAFDAALAAVDGCEDPCVAGHVLVRSRVRLFLGELERVVESQRRAQRLLAGGCDPLHRLQAHEGLGMALMQLGRYDEAEVEYRRAADGMRDGAYVRPAAGASNNLGVFLALVGRWGEAEARFADALDGARRCDMSILEAVSLANLGECALIGGDREVARRRFETARELAARAGYERTRLVAIASLGRVAQADGRWEEALAHYREARQAPKIPWEQPWLEATIPVLSAVARVELGRSVSGLVLDEAVAVADRLGDPFVSAVAAVCRLHVALASGAATRGATAAAAREIADRIDALARTVRPNRRHLADFALGLLEARLAARPSPGPSPSTVSAGAPSGSGLRVAADGSTFTLPGAAPVSLGRRASAKRVLAVLARRRVEAPGVPISTPDLCDEVWPEVNVDVDVLANRLYVTMSRLRKLGLGDLIVHDGDGYRLASGTPLVLTR